MNDAKVVFFETNTIGMRPFDTDYETDQIQIYSERNHNKKKKIRQLKLNRFVDPIFFIIKMSKSVVA